MPASAGFLLAYGSFCLIMPAYDPLWLLLAVYGQPQTNMRSHQQQ